MTSPGCRGKEIEAFTVVFTAFILRLMPKLWKTSFPVGYYIPSYAIGASHFVGDSPLRMLVSLFLVSSILWAFYIIGLNLHVVLKISLNWRNLKSLKLFSGDDIAIYELVGG